MESTQPDATTFDFVIIGSGFGGSVSAMRLSEKGYRVLVLERGKRYRPEDFPRTNWNVFKSVWLPAARCFGIMGINLLPHILILNGSGVGGGSLVYASTHIEPSDHFYDDVKWSALADWKAELAPHFATANRMLGVTPNPYFGPADEIFYDIAKELGREETFAPTPVAIYFGEPGETVPDPFFDGEGPDRTGCTFCGGCMVGCRYGAKNTLDQNYLYFAEKWGTEIRAESNVLDIRPLPADGTGPRYEVVYERTTDWLQKRRYAVRTRNVVVSGGVLGTVDLLLRCRDETGSLPLLSSQLGKLVRSNSEALMGVTAREEFADFSQGTAITSHFWVDDVTSVEPVRYPRGSSLMRNLAMPLVDLEGTLWARLRRFISYGLKNPYDLLKVRLLPDWARDSTIVLVMQTLENRMHLSRGRSIWTLGRRGLVSERDASLPIPTIIEAGRAVVERFAARIGGVPQSTINELMLDTPSTAHILGGCGIGAGPDTGVVDVNHQAFNYPGLYVVDGSVIPANLGVNPSLTITAMAERAMSKIPPAPTPWQDRYAHRAHDGQDAAQPLPAPLPRALLAAAAAAILGAAALLWRRRNYPGDRR